MNLKRRLKHWNKKFVQGGVRMQKKMCLLKYSYSMWQKLENDKNNMIFFCVRKTKIYEVVKNNKINRRMGLENDIKHKRI